MGTNLKTEWNPWAVDGTGGGTATPATGLGGAWSWLDENQQGDEDKKLVIDWANMQLNGKGGDNKILVRGDAGLQAMSATRFMAGIMNAKPEDIRRYQQALKDSGYLPDTYIVSGNAMDSDNAFVSGMLKAANQISVQNLTRYTDLVNTGKKGEPLDFYSQLKTLEGTGGGNQVSTNTSAMNFTEGETRALLEGFYGEALGRRPNEDEIAKFQKRINAKAKANPNISTTTYTSGGSQSSDKEGFTAADAENMARNAAENKPGAHGFIASTKYMDAFLGSLRGKVNQL